MEILSYKTISIASYPGGTVQLKKQAKHEMSLVVRKTVFRVSDQVKHKPDCTAKEDGYRLEISYLGSRGIVLSM